jgi:hypothetical protein
MRHIELPGGGRAWFVREGRRGRRGLRPASPEGRALTALYAAVVGASSLLFAGDGFSGMMVAAWIVLIVAATILYVVTALRMSARPPETGKGGAGCS